MPYVKIFTLILLALAAVLLTARPDASVSAAITLYVDDDDPTCGGNLPCHSSIQEAIDFAVDGDTVLVAPGTYEERIDFLGKAITIASEEGPEETVVDGNEVDPVVTFASGEGPLSVLTGLTLQNGGAAFYYPPYRGGGISVEDSSPTIFDNIIVNNTACAGGGGIGIKNGSPIIEQNIIANNSQISCSGGGGGGISILGDSDAQIVDNIISNNFWRSGHGGGIRLSGAGNPTIRGNVITGNTATGIHPASSGGGIDIVNSSESLIVQNLIANNSAGKGGGISWSVAGPGPLLVNNTIAGNYAPQGGSGIYSTAGPQAEPHLINNIVVATEGQTAIFCELSVPVLEFNNVFSPLGTAYSGSCGDQTGVNGNISADPLFLDQPAGDYHLKAGSPSIDAGDNAAANLPGIDFEGDPRILDGDGDGTAVVDMGIDEFAEVTVDIDIKPGSDPNSTNLGSRGIIPVAILTTGAFDAVTVDPATVDFEGASPVHDALEDVDGDGDLDLIMHFRTQEADIADDAAEACLTGETFDGQPIQGCDVIRIVPPELDSDGDGFGDAVEASMRTDQYAACPTDSGHDAWPPDADGDQDSDIGDLIALFLGNIFNPPAYSARSDFDGDGDNDVGDVIGLFLGKVMTSCA